jgi:hypothetical protein
MQEQLISYRTAILAKEKYFDWVCRAYFKATSSDVIRETVDSGISYGALPGNEKVTCYLRPTQSLLQKWLREVHKLSVEVGNEYQLKSWNCYIVNQDNDSKPILTKDDEYFSTYEAALEEGLYKALKNDSI